MRSQRTRATSRRRSGTDKKIDELSEKVEEKSAFIDDLKHMSEFNSEKIIYVEEKIELTRRQVDALRAHMSNYKKSVERNITSLGFDIGSDLNKLSSRFAETRHYQHIFVGLIAVVCTIFGTLLAYRVETIKSKSEGAELVLEIIKNVKGDPRNALAELSVMCDYIDQQTCNKLQETYKNLVKKKVDQGLGNEGGALSKESEEIIGTAIAKAKSKNQEKNKSQSKAEKLEKEIAKDIVKEADKKLVYVVVYSIGLKRYNAENEAIRLAKSLRNSYRSEVWRNKTGPGYYSVTVGRYPMSKAIEIKKKVVKKPGVRPDTFLSIGKNFTTRVWPARTTKKHSTRNVEVFKRRHDLPTPVDRNFEYGN